MLLPPWCADVKTPALVGYCALCWDSILRSSSVSCAVPRESPPLLECEGSTHMEFLPGASRSGCSTQLDVQQLISGPSLHLRSRRDASQNLHRASRVCPLLLARVTRGRSENASDCAYDRKRAAYCTLAWRLAQASCRSRNIHCRSTTGKPSESAAAGVLPNIELRRENIRLPLCLRILNRPRA